MSLKTSHISDIVYTGFSNLCRKYEKVFNPNTNIKDVLKEFKNKGCTLVVSCTGAYYTYHKTFGWETHGY